MWVEREIDDPLTTQLLIEEGKGRKFCHCVRAPLAQLSLSNLLYFLRNTQSHFHSFVTLGGRGGGGDEYAYLGRQKRKYFRCSILLESSRDLKTRFSCGGKKGFSCHCTFFFFLAHLFYL